jgi:aryl-alcohol dehydrogenase-like predicted oxidoreductase
MSVESLPAADRIAFGGATVVGESRHVAEDDAREIVLAALRAGVRFFDTASMYAGGKSEALLGEVLEPSRSTITLLTKGGVSYPDLHDLRVSTRDSSYDALRRSLEGSLSRLRTDSVDIFLIHQQDPSIEPEAAMANLRRLVDDGLTREVGFSNFGADAARRAFATGIPTYVEYSCSLLDRRYLGELAAAAEAGCRRLGYGTFVHGLLSEDLSGDTQFEPNDWRHRARTAGNAVNSGSVFFTGAAYARNVEIAHGLREIAVGLGVRLAVLVLALTLREQRTDLTIVGCRSVEELHEDLSALRLQLDDATLGAVHELLSSADRPTVNALGPTSDDASTSSMGE